MIYNLKYFGFKNSTRQLILKLVVISTCLNIAQDMNKYVLLVKSYINKADILALNPYQLHLSSPLKPTTLESTLTVPL